MTTIAFQQLTIFIAHRLVVQVYSGERVVERCALVSQVQAVPYYLVRCVGVLSMIGQNNLSCDWSE